MKGWLKTSLIDYEDKISSVFYYGGCNFRCPYCHNPQLVINTERIEDIDFDKALNYLKGKNHLYEGVCISGGEPTIHSDLSVVVKKLRATGLAIKLDTNGSNFELLKELVENNLIAYVALDVKTSFSKYSHVLSEKKDSEKIIGNVKNSLKYIIEQDKIDYELRSTIYPPYFEDSDLGEIAKSIKGAQKYYLQQFNSKVTLQLNTFMPYSMEKLIGMKDYFSKFVGKCEIR